ncbi:hypothetical protein [Deinococcus hopiensis]|uniref:Uncharacterized protein n=1 Tax=Deinococcus hopiensis KR-140 TaxID=695939 RepID=A0A1W1ULD3_9DEIO|nr:hypothetical protein [Deinococcus hopiensis]SMB81860.1 hypothetical protein SAMN00790413_04748 [Deinococcus hopiensis KR-140]
MSHFDLNTLDVRTQNVNTSGPVTPDSTPTPSIILWTATGGAASVVYSVITGTSKRCW